MVDKKLRKAIDAYCNDVELDYPTVLFDSPSFDHSIVGFTEEGVAIYSFDKMVKEFMKDEEYDATSEEDENDRETAAIEFIEYNTLRSLGYINSSTDGHAPIILMDTVQSIKEKYGE